MQTFKDEDTQKALCQAINQLGKLSVAHVEARGAGLSFCLHTTKKMDFLVDLITDLMKRSEGKV